MCLRKTSCSSLIVLVTGVPCSDSNVASIAFEHGNTAIGNTLIDNGNVATEAPARFARQQLLPESLLGVDTVVAAPILDKDGNVIGALYGECREDSVGARKSSRVTKLEADLAYLV